MLIFIKMVKKDLGEKMKKENSERKAKEKFLIREIEMPPSLEIEVKDNEILAKKENNEIKRRFDRVLMGKEGNKLIIKIKGVTKNEKKQINTIVAHIKNIIQGLEKKFIYKLQICSIHFPMNVSIKENNVIIKNFLGGAKERKAKILPNVEVKIEKEIITVESTDKEAAGQTAANIEKTTRVRRKDIRVFQDGIYLIEKAGRKI